MAIKVYPSFHAVPLEVVRGPAPKVVSYRHADSVRYAIAGTDYGFLSTTLGDVRTFKTYTCARRALLKKYPEQAFKKKGNES